MGTYVEGQRQVTDVELGPHRAMEHTGRPRPAQPSGESGWWVASQGHRQGAGGGGRLPDVGGGPWRPTGRPGGRVRPAREPVATGRRGCHVPLRAPLEEKVIRCFL